MQIFDDEKDIENLVKNNKVSCDSQLIENKSLNVESLNNICKGNACAIASLAPKNYQPTEDVMPISSILVTDIWNANNDVFTSEEILSRYSTAKFKPINWMHKGSEETENENIGVMLETTLVQGDIPEVNIITASDGVCKNPRGCSGKIHVKQDGIIWSGYFPTYASKIKKGIKDSKLFVSMECFFEDFGYALRENEDSEIIFVDRKPSNSKMSKDLTAFGGSGKTKYEGKTYQIGRWLKNITFSGQGVVYEPANKRNNKIYSIIFAALNPAVTTQDLQNANFPIPTLQSPGTPLSPAEMQDDTSNLSMTDTPEDLKKKRELPTTYEPPADGFLFFTAKEAQKVGEIKLGCTGYHLYQENRHGDQPLLYSALIADPTDLEKQMAIPQYRPCADERELRFALNELGLSTETETSYYIDKPEGTTKPALDENGNPVAGCVTTTINPQFPLCVINSTTCAPTSAATNTDNPNCAPYLSGSGGTGTQSLAPQNNNQGGNSELNGVTTGGSKMKSILNEVSKTLTKKQNKVYTNNEGKMSEIKENKELHKATAENIALKQQIGYAEEAIDLAAKHIEAMNKKLSRLGELEKFKAEAEAIIETAYQNKLGQERLETMRNLVGESYDGADFEELRDMSDESFEQLKKAVSKVSEKIDRTISEQEALATAARSVQMAKKTQASKASFVVASTREKPADIAKNLINHALKRK